MQLEYESKLLEETIQELLSTVVEVTPTSCKEVVDMMDEALFWMLQDDDTQRQIALVNKLKVLKNILHALDDGIRTRL
ncbi:hypothetical protein BGX34_000625 [Mortierella sp. NVP85]|nr:hypothetical protein BGX34_000625 [Mortierella sp. NVP85]